MFFSPSNKSSLLGAKSVTGRKYREPAHSSGTGKLDQAPLSSSTSPHSHGMWAPDLMLKGVRTETWTFVVRGRAPSCTRYHIRSVLEKQKHLLGWPSCGKGDSTTRHSGSSNNMRGSRKERVTIFLLMCFLMFWSSGNHTLWEAAMNLNSHWQKQLA